MNDSGSDNRDELEEVDRLRRELQRERQRRKRLQSFVAQTSDGIIVHDGDGEIVDVTLPACELLGYDEAELLDLSIGDLKDPFDSSVATETWSAVLDGEVRTFEGTLRRSDGSRVPVGVELRPFDQEDRDLILGVVRDITNRRRTESLLEARNRMYQTVFRHSVEAIYVADIESRRIMQANPAFCELLGFEVAEALGMQIDEFVVESSDSVDDYLRALQEGESIANLERTWRRRDGATVEVEVTASGMQLPNSNRDIFFVVARDVTEEKELQTRMIQMDRMIAMGTLAAGVGHEINNPLSYIIANLQFGTGVLDEHLEASGDLDAEQWNSDLQELREALEEAEEGARRIHDIVGDLKTLAGSDDSRDLDSVSIQRVLTSSVNIVWNEIRNRASFETDIADVPPVLATESRLGQVFVNLLINAAQAIPPGDADEHEIRVSAHQEADEVVLRVTDSGRGIPPEVIDRIFDPFFTTKEEDEGTGLGLAITRRIIESMGGTIDVESDPGERTTFTVRLKASDEGSDLAQPTTGEEVEFPDELSVMVVDSDEKIGETFRRLLRAEHELHSVRSWSEAKTELGERRDLDIVFSEVMLPNATAVDIYQWIKRQMPGLLPRLVFMTGGSVSERTNRLIDRTQNPCLLKPLDREGLRSTIDEVVAR